MLLVSEPIVGAEEKAALIDVINSNWLTMGDRVREFELALASAHEVDDAVAVSSCTAALHLILLALDLGPGDEVLVPSLTFVATANCVRYVGATPVFVDIESLDTPLMSIADAEARCTPRTKAVIVMHYGGYLNDRAAWRAFAHRRKLKLIEDAAHSPGLPGVGTFGDAAALSFYGNKNMTTAEGGAVLAEDPLLLEKIRQLRAHGMTSGTRQRLDARTPTYDVTLLGYNYRMDELRAAIGLVQLQHLARWNERRCELVGQYRRALQRNNADVVAPFPRGRASVCHIMPVVLPSGISRQTVIDRLRAAGIQTSIHYTPVHEMSFYRHAQPDLRLPVTEEFSRRELTLPLHPKMDEAAVDRVASAIASAVASARADRVVYA